MEGGKKRKDRTNEPSFFSTAPFRHKLAGDSTYWQVTNSSWEWLLHVLDTTSTTHVCSFILWTTTARAPMMPCISFSRTQLTLMLPASVSLQRRWWLCSVICVGQSPQDTIVLGHVCSNNKTTLEYQYQSIFKAYLILLDSDKHCNKL
jgi:hypothetical protein